MGAVHMRENYRSVSIPIELYNKIQKIVKKRSYGYRSVSEFVTDAIRRRVEKIEEQQVEEVITLDES